MASIVPCGIGAASLPVLLDSFYVSKLELAADIVALIGGGLGFPLCLSIAVMRFCQAKVNITSDTAVRYMVRW